MNQSVLEAVLCDAYREEIGVYTQALGLAEEVARGLGDGSPSATALTAMMDALDAIAAIESRIVVAKQTWRQQHYTPGPQLKAVLDQAAQVIGRLATHIQQAEQSAAAHKARLAPELDANSRGRQMQQAYGQVMNQRRASGVA